MMDHIEGDAQETSYLVNDHDGFVLKNISLLINNSDFFM